MRFAIKHLVAKGVVIKYKFIVFKMTTKSPKKPDIQKVVMGPRNLQKTVKIRKFGGFWTVSQ